MALYIICHQWQTRNHHHYPVQKKGLLSAQNELTDFFRTYFIMHTVIQEDSDPGGSVEVLEGNFGQLLDFWILTLMGAFDPPEKTQLLGKKSKKIIDPKFRF